MQPDSTQPHPNPRRAAAEHVHQPKPSCYSTFNNESFRLPLLGAASILIQLHISAPPMTPITSIIYPSTPSSTQHPIIQPEYNRCISIVDVHFHLSQWFLTADPLLAEMDLSYVTAGLLMAVYPRTAMSATNPNEDVAHMIEEGGGRIFGLASLNRNPGMVSNIGSLTRYHSCVWPYLSQYLELDQK
jgi:hypothetical protein